MKPCGSRQRELFWLFVLLLVAFLANACSPGDAEVPTAVNPDSGPAATATPAPAPEDEVAALAGVPAEARVATRPGDPRPPAYWALWNRCAPDNRADTAAANGGRAAGWFLMDDFIADPGIRLGEYPITTCAEGLALLQAVFGAGAGNEEIEDLGGRLLAAELNLNAGAETCPIAEETVVAAHLVLEGAGFDGSGEYEGKISEEIAGAIPRVRDLLALYNRGALCR